MMPTHNAGRGITRIDTLPSCGYLVRLHRHGKNWSRFFSDRRCGGKRQAKKEAKECYAELCQQVAALVRRSTRKRSANNRSGVVGVHLAVSSDHRWMKKRYTAYCASWMDEEGMRRKISFSCKKYGKKKAFELAVLAREQRSLDRDGIAKMHRQKKGKNKTPAGRNRKSN